MSSDLSGGTGGSQAEGRELVPALPGLEASLAGRGTYLRLVLVTFFWGATFVAAKVAMSELPPFTVGIARLVFSALLFALLVTRSGQGKGTMTRADLLYMAVLGILGISLYNVFFYLGLNLTSATNASLIIALNPVVTSVFSSMFLKEKFTVWRSIGVVGSFMGVVVVITKGSLGEMFDLKANLGDLLLFGCPLTWGTYTVMLNRVKGRIPTLTASAYITLFGTLMMLPLGVWEWSRLVIAVPSLYAVIAILFMAVFSSTLSQVWWVRSVGEVGPSRTVVFMNLVPVFAMVLAFLGLNEQISLLQILGTLLVVGGVSLACR